MQADALMMINYIFHIIFVATFVLYSDFSYAKNHAKGCRINWPEFIQEAEPTDLRAVHVSKKNFCKFKLAAGELTILPDGQKPHYCEINFPAKASGTLKNGWFVNRLNIEANGARWIMKRNRRNNGFSLRLQGSIHRPNNIRIKSISFRNKDPKASCDHPQKGWKSLF